MLVNFRRWCNLPCYTNDINLRYFYFNGQSYTTGTEVELTQDYITAHSSIGNKIWRYARFVQKSYDCKTYKMMKCRYDPYSKERTDYILYFTIPVHELEQAIKVIVKPVPVELVHINPKKDWEVDGMFILWIIYVVILFLSLIFKEFYLIWIATSFVFFNIRKKMLNG